VLISDWMHILARCEDPLRSPAKKLKTRKVAKLFILLAAALAFSPPFVRGQSKPSDRHTIVISVDGMCASRYRSPSPELHIPNILRLKKQGSFAEGVEGIYPTVTYPSHTTIVTGRLPAEHGIYTNVSAREPGEHSRDWFWFSKAIKVPTLWDEARRAGLTTAAVSWPVTAGAAIDWDFPEIWDPAKGELMDFELVGRYSTPGLLQEAMAALHPQPGMDSDLIRTEVAAYVLKKYKPNLLLLHLNDLDHNQHEAGPESELARTTLERIDGWIGDILDAVKQSGLADSTNVFIVSDHGFLPIEKMLNPGVLLAQASLVTVNDKGYISGGKVFTISNGGSFFIYWPEGQDLRAEVNAALKPLFDQGLVWAVFDPDALKELGADPGAQMALEPPTGYTFGSRATGDLVTPLKKPGGTHGYFPYREGSEASFIAWGPDIRTGVDLHRIPMTAVGPTILKAMGIDDPKFGDSPALRDVFK
jgi:predicted AlkP superfamily pyrophosphatase or phosphodiesterase